MTPGKQLGVSIAAVVMLNLSGLAAMAQDAATGRLDNNRMFKSGQEAFEKICARCHTGRPDSVGPEFFSKGYDADTIKYFVRNGFAGMPAFTESMIDNATLDELAAYVATQAKGAPK